MTTKQEGCQHGSWTYRDTPVGKCRCLLCGAIGLDLHFFQPDDQPWRLAPPPLIAAPSQSAEPEVIPAEVRGALDRRSTPLHPRGRGTASDERTMTNEREQPRGPAIRKIEVEI